MSEKTHIYLVRHGVTDANLVRPRILSGQGDDSPLNDPGIKQAEWAADQLKDNSFSTAYSSPLKRCVKTAEIISEPHGIEVVTHQGLIENNCGRWEHKSWEWIMEHDREAYDKWMESPDIHPYPEGETFTQVAERFTCAVSEIAEEHEGKNILVVAHNTTNKNFLAQCLGLPLKRSRSIPYANCGISLVEYAPRKGFEVKMLNFSERYI